MKLQDYNPKLLEDKSKLDDIYMFRVFCWENSEQKEFINSKYFPNGWKDKFDENAVHWIVESNKEIIASSRVCILDNVNEIEEDFSKFLLPKNIPFAFFSRLVVHPSFRGNGISNLMDYERLKFIKHHNISFTLASVESDIGRKNKLISLGFEELGTFKHQYTDNPKIKTSMAFILHLEKINLR